MDDLEDFVMQRPPTADRPLLGLTVLAVEDSRFACEAIRMMCLRSGARIRRADCLRSAARHLRVYRPSVAIVDLGLPDGSGLDLIRDLAEHTPRVGVILGSSGDDGGEAAALDAGADGFLAKPVRSLAGFQQAILDHLPSEVRPAGPRQVPNDLLSPDRLALKDDLNRIAGLLDRGASERTLDYIAQFLGGVAISAEDGGLKKAAERLRAARRDPMAGNSAVATVASILRERLARVRAV